MAKHAYVILPVLHAFGWHWLWLPSGSSVSAAKLTPTYLPAAFNSYRLLISLAVLNPLLPSLAG
jgi:hypothetical protein